MDEIRTRTKPDFAHDAVNLEAKSEPPVRKFYPTNKDSIAASDLPILPGWHTPPDLSAEANREAADYLRRIKK